MRAFARRAGHRIVAVFKDTTSGSKNDRVERKKVMALAQAREIDAILVTELSRWGRRRKVAGSHRAVREARMAARGLGSWMRPVEAMERHRPSRPVECVASVQHAV